MKEKQNQGSELRSLVKEQILAIRDSGETNMLDAYTVQRIADREGFYELVSFIDERRDDYASFILSGDEALLPE